jgi:hypothetical protein
MRGESDKDYEIGYGKTPVATRFKKGQSGNPSGKQKKVAQELDPGKVLQSIDNEVIFVNDNSKRKRMTKAEIHFRQLFAKAIKGDLTAARLVAKMAAEYFGPEAESPSDVQVIVVRDRARKSN